MSRQRDDAVDILRGVAVVTMIAANLSSRALAEPDPPLWFRWYGSFAAPLFVLLAGMMIAKTHADRRHGLRFFALRGLMLLAGGAFIDVFLERIYPFTSMDVLYLLGVSLPLGYLCCYFRPLVRWGLALAIFAAAPMLQHYLGYTEYPTEYELSGKMVDQSTAAATRTSIVNHWFVDGWFPLVPWFGFTLLGLNLAGLRWQQQQTRSFGVPLVLVLGTFFLSAGVVVAWAMPVPPLTRAGYSEMFYPPTLFFVLTACGVMLLLFWTADRLPHWPALGPVIFFGQTALFIYLFHRGVIAIVISNRRQPMEWFLLVYAGVLVACFIAAYAYRWVRTYMREMLDL